MNTVQEPTEKIVTATITRTDLFRLGWHFGWRQRWLSLFCLFCFGISLWFQWHSENRPTHWFHVIYFLAYYAVVWGALWGFFITVVGVATALQVSSGSGVLGSHRYEIRDAGFFESTTANETLTRWSAIRRVTRNRRYTLISLTWWLFHLIPHRAFPDAATADAFYHELQLRIDRNG